MAYRSVIELDPKNTQAWNKLGDLQYSSGAHEEGLHAYQQAIDSGQGSLLSYGTLAANFIQKGCFSEAIPLIQKGIKLSQVAADTICLWNQLGDVYRRLDDYEHAMAAYRNADLLNPQTAAPQTGSPSGSADLQFTPSEDLFVQPESNFKLGCMQEQARQPKPAEPAMTCPPDDSPAMDENSTISGGPEPGFITWLDGLASVMTSFHKHEMNGAAGPDPAASENPDETEKNLELLFVQPEADYPVFTKDEPIQPVKDKSTGCNEQSDGLPGNLSIPKPDQPAEAEPSKSPAAETANQTSSAIEEENAHLWNELGTIYSNTGAFDQAINAFKKAIELDRSYGWSYNNLAALFSRQGRFKEAISFYQKGLQFLGEARDKALLWNRLGDAYRRLNQHDRASAAYRKAMELDPDNVSLLTRARFSLLGNCRA
jgi:tetratricopeptide (TPR) repeat protein